MRHSFTQSIQLCVFIPVELSHEHLNFGEVRVKLFLALLEVGKFGAGSGEGVRVTEGIVEDPDNVFRVLQLDGLSLNEGEDLALYPTLKPVESLCHLDSGSRETYRVAEELKTQLGNRSFEGVTVAIVYGGVGDLVTPAVSAPVKNLRIPRELP